MGPHTPSPRSQKSINYGYDVTRIDLHYRMITMRDESIQKEILELDMKLRTDTAICFA